MLEQRASHIQTIATIAAILKIADPSRHNVRCVKDAIDLVTLADKETRGTEDA